MKKNWVVSYKEIKFFENSYFFELLAVLFFLPVHHGSNARKKTKKKSQWHVFFYKQKAGNWDQDEGIELCLFGRKLSCNIEEIYY